MQNNMSSSADAANSILTSRESSKSPEGVGRILLYLVLAAAAGLAALEIELSNIPEEATQSETQPRPAPTSGRSQS